MSKLLSLIIPTYNMEALLPTCLDSVLHPDALDRLEVLVVNDGSRDRSLAIARDYADRYPDTVIAIDKPNGNYGSTVNAALPVARGRYVKLLDADDTFDTAALLQLLDALDTLDADLVITHYLVLHADGSTELARYNLYGKEPYEYGRTYPLDDVLADGYIRFFLMHAITWRTDVLRQNGYHQTEGISYTDLEWDTYPLFWAHTVCFLPLTVYRYNMARPGQTMDPAVLIRSVSQLETVTDQLLAFLRQHDPATLPSATADWMRRYYLNRLRLVLKAHLLDMPRDQFDANHFADLFDRYTQAADEHHLGTLRLYPENKIIHIDAIRYWRRHHSRFPKLLEQLNHLADRIMTRLYRLLFRR